MVLARLNNLLYCYLSFVCFTAAIKVPTEWTRDSAKLLSNYRPNDEKLAGETGNRDTINKKIKLKIQWPKYSENLEQATTNFDDVEIIKPELLNNKYQQNYFQYAAPKPRFAVQIAQVHGVPNPHQQYKATPVQPYTLHSKPSPAASAIQQNPSPVFEPFNKFIASREHLDVPLSPISSNYEIFHPYKAEKPYLKQLSRDPAYRQVKQDVKTNGKRLKKYEKAAGNVDIPKEDYLKSPEQIDDDKFNNDKNIPTEFENYSAEKKPIYYEQPKKQHIPHEYLNQKLKYPFPHNYAKTKPVHYAPLRNHILNLKQQQGVRFGDENDQYPEIKHHSNNFAEPPDGYDIYEKQKQNYENLNNNFNKDFNAFAAGQESDGPTHRKAPRNEQHHDYINYEPSKDIEEDFVPIKMYAQVRKTETTKHLPREEAYNEAETPDEILNAPRLREAVKSTKAQTVYTEEGYEDSAYDHAGHQKHASNEEGHGGYLKKNEKSAGKYKIPSVSGGHEDGGGSAVGHSISSGKKWKDLDEDSIKHDDIETLNADEGEISESQNFDLNEAGSETKFIEAPKKPKTSLSMTKDSEKTTIKEANDGMLVSTKSQHVRLSNDKNLASDLEYTELPTVKEKVKPTKPAEDTQARRESITKMTKVLPTEDIARLKRGVEFEVPSFSLKNTYLTEDDILAISKQEIGAKENFNKTKYPYYNSKIIDRNSPLRYAENIKNIPSKSKGGTEFYDSRSHFECAEVEPIIDPVPERIKSLPDGKKEDMHDDEEDVEADDNEPNTSEVNQNQSGADFSGVKKQPRLKGLGDSIDCFKAKYFDENPLDSPFFQEELIENPEPLTLPPIPYAEKKIQAEEMKASSSDDVLIIQPAESIEVADLNKPADSAEQTQAIEQADTVESSKNPENLKRSGKYVNPSYLDLVLKVLTHKLGYIPKDLHKRVYRDISQQHGRDLKDILRNYYTLSDNENDGYTSQQIRTSNAKDDEDEQENIDSLNDEDDEHLSKSIRYTNDNELPAENLNTSSDDDDGNRSKYVESDNNERISSEENKEDGEYENKTDRSTHAENNSGTNQNIRSSDDDSDEFVAKYVRPSTYEYHEYLNTNLHSSRDDNGNKITKQKHQHEDDKEMHNENIRPLNKEHQENLNENIRSSNNDKEEYNTENTRQTSDEDEGIYKKSRPISEEDFEKFYEKIRSWHNEGDDNITNDRETSKVDDIDNRNQNIEKTIVKSSEYINGNDEKFTSADEDDTHPNTGTSDKADNKNSSEKIRTPHGDDEEATHKNLHTINKEDNEDVDHNIRKLDKDDKQNTDDINQNISTFNDGEGVNHETQTSHFEDYEDVNRNIPNTTDEDVNQNARSQNFEDERLKKQSILASSDDYDEYITKTTSNTKDNDSINNNVRPSSDEDDEYFYENIQLSKEKDNDDLNEYVYPPNLEDFNEFENVFPIKTQSDNITEAEENIGTLSTNGDEDTEILNNSAEKPTKDVSKENQSEKIAGAKKPSYLNLVLKVLSPDIDFRSLNTYSDIIKNIRLSKDTVKENKRLLQNSDSTATNVHNKENTKQIRRKRSTDFKYEPYKVIENYQMDTKNKMKQTTISPLLKRMLSPRVSNVDKTHVVKRDTMFKPYTYIDRTHRRAARGHIEPTEETLVIVDVDPRRGEPRYEVLTPANHKSQYTPVTFKKSLSMGDYKAGRLTLPTEEVKNEEEDEEEDEEEEEDVEVVQSNNNLEHTNQDELKDGNETKDLDKNEQNINRGHLQEISTTINPVFDVNNYLPTIKPHRRRGNSTKIRKHNNLNSKTTYPSAYVELATLPPTQVPQNELQATKTRHQNAEKSEEPIMEYSDYEVDDEPKTTKKPLPKKRVILIKHTSTRAPQKYIDYSDYEETDDMISTTTEIPRVKIRIRNKKVESLPVNTKVELNNQKLPEADEEDENHLETNEEEEEETREDIPVELDNQDFAIEPENAAEEVDSGSEEKIPVEIKNNSNENENEEDDIKSPKIIEKSSKKRKNAIRTTSTHYENDKPDQTTKEQINEMMGDDQKLQEFVPREKEIVHITSRKAPSEATTHKLENTSGENTSRTTVPSRPKNRRRRIKIRKKPQVQLLNKYEENQEDEKVLAKTKPKPIKSEKLQLFRDKELAKNVNDLEDKHVLKPETLPDSEVEIVRDNFQMNDGPRHGGNYRMTPELEATMKTQNLELKEDDDGINGVVTKLHGGNLKRNHGEQIERSAEVLNGFASAMPILATTPIYIEDPAERMYYFVDS